MSMDSERIIFDNDEYRQIIIDFSDSGNMCVILFLDRSSYGIDILLDGHENPSFTAAFKDYENVQDMIMILTSIIRYLDTDLSLEEAERLAVMQDKTISTDGYAMPLDIGGYQMQARHTYPHIFLRTPYFNSSYGVQVRALKHLWLRAIDTKDFYELSSKEDYDMLNIRIHDASIHPDIVYSDFLVKNTWQHQSYLHGETWVIVDVESMNGRQFSLSLDTWRFPDAYEFGVGQIYTIYIETRLYGGIVYAVQISQSSQQNSRGQVHPIDYPAYDWQYPLNRIEPQGEGTVFDVSFLLRSQSLGESFAALEGHGLGEKQWPNDPVWEDYAFVGWYDNIDWHGNPYTKDTPIFQDTFLYARWEYTGPGGTWPRAHRGYIEGIDEANGLYAGQNLTITANGYNMHLESPSDRRFRWIPISWRLSDETSGMFTSEMPFQADISFNNEGEKWLYITYLEETFDGTSWQKTGQVHEVKERSLIIDADDKY